MKNIPSLRLARIALSVIFSTTFVFGEENPELSRATQLSKQVAGMYKAGKYRDAIPFAEEALAIREKILGPKDPDIATSLCNLAVIYMAMGDYTKTEPLYQRALVIYEKSLGPEHSNTSICLNSLALLYQSIGDYAKAEPLHQRALAIREKVFGPEHPNTATSLCNLAELYRIMSNYSKAEPLYLRALAIEEKALGPEHLSTATTLHNLGLLYHSTDRSKAEPLFKRALAIHEKALGPEHPDTATSLGNLAMVYFSSDKYEMAEPLCKRELAIREKVLGPEHPDTAISLNNLGELYSAMGNITKAEPLIKRAIAIHEKVLGPEHPDTAVNIANLAYLKFMNNQPAEALKLASQAGQAEEKTLANILSFSSEQQRSEFQKMQRPYHLPATLGDAPLIARTLLHWKGVVLDSVLEDRAVARAAGEKGLRGQLETMKNLQAQILKLTLETPSDTSEAGLRSRAQQREKLSHEMEKMEAALARNVTALGQSRQALKVTPEQIHSALGPQEVLVEFIRYRHYLGRKNGEYRYGAVIFTKKGKLEWISLGAAEDIEKTISLYQKSARGKTDEATLQNALHELHGKIWAPIEKALPKNTKSVILSPDAELNFVSFATLLGEDDKFLAEKYLLRYVSSGRDLLRTTSKDSSSIKKPILLYGNPDFLLAKAGKRPTPSPSLEPLVAMRDAEIRDFRNVTLSPLAGTAAECSALAKMAKKTGGAVEIKTGPEATEAALQEIQSPRLLHLATHGFFLPESPDLDKNFNAGINPKSEIRNPQLLKNPMHRSGLALAGAKTTLDAWGQGKVPASENDGILTAEEVGTLNLTGTWLVTLSACETGSGQARAGEGVLGLRRGFIQAGAQNLLMTLWPINDETTVQIMLEFYESAFASGDAPRSLIEVQRKWLVKLSQEKGLLQAVNLAGPFILSSQGKAVTKEGSFPSK